MYIIFDGRQIKNKYSGLARFTFSLLLKFIEFNQFDKLEILVEKNIDLDKNEIFKYILGLKIEKITLTDIDAPLFNLYKGYNITRYVNKKNPDLYFHPHFDLPFGIKAKSIFVVHDVLSKKTFYHENENNFLSDFFYAIKKKRFIKNFIFNNYIKYNLKNNNINCIAVSNATKLDLLEFIDVKYENKIKVVYEASFDNTLLKSEDSNVFENKIFENRYILYVGDRRPHKNLKKMIDIFIELNKIDKNLFFYIVGSKEKIYFDYEFYINSLKNENILLFHNISDELLEIFYKKSEVFFFLSKHEGFGLPLLEAAKFNKKIITSNRSSMYEISPKTSLFLDPYIKEDIAAETISSYLKNDILIDNESYISNFSWELAMKEIFYNG